MHHRPPDRRPRDRNDADRANRLRVVVSSASGGLLGLVLGVFLSVRHGDAPLSGLYPLLLAGAGWIGAWAVVSLVTRGAGALAETIYMPGGGGGGRRREHSLAESLAARGRYEDAVSAWEVAVSEDPADPVPYLAIARTLRDRLGRSEEAARWFRRARSEAELDEGRSRMVTRELIELLERSGRPARAAPELARLAEEHAGSPDGEWARKRLAEVKALIARELE